MIAAILVFAAPAAIFAPGVVRILNLAYGAMFMFACSRIQAPKPARSVVMVGTPSARLSSGVSPQGS